MNSLPKHDSVNEQYNSLLEDGAVTAGIENVHVSTELQPRDHINQIRADMSQ